MEVRNRKEILPELFSANACCAVERVDQFQSCSEAKCIPNVSADVCVRICAFRENVLEKNPLEFPASNNDPGGFVTLRKPGSVSGGCHPTCAAFTVLNGYVLAVMMSVDTPGVAFE